MAYQKYTDEQQAHFLIQLEVLGYPDNEHAPKEVAKRKGAPTERTLRRWWKIRNNPEVAKVVRQEKVNTVEALQDLLNLHIQAASEAVQGSEDLRAIDTGIGILIDKLQLLTGQPTERNDSRIIFERTGLSTIPEHLASGTVESGARVEKIQRSGMRSPVG